MCHLRKMTVFFVVLFILGLQPFCGTGKAPFGLDRMQVCQSVWAAAPESEDDQEEDDTLPESASPYWAPDPLEPLNRFFFAFNDKVYFWFWKPLAQIYGIFIPPGIRTGVTNAFQNIKFPSRFVNCILQGKFRSAGIEAERFLINSTLGLGGFFEFAGPQFNLSPQDEDTGQTLAHYGMKPVMYLVIPILGPSTLRDGIGLVGDTFLNPMYYIPQELWVGFAMRGGVIVNNLSFRIGEYEDFKEAALDPYISMRQAFFQYRYNELLK